ncbi:AAA family ATPase [Streptomyces millisiae]|uniref:ATP-binding protein n=1 Tax=Streptomyces millisiae TaxID=3075542 RepID=A0ABU2LRE0_9ACTN|nr:ATP-binding protein [Streptomyces sp. DSM 44918]MDT0320159.1 ATP-binding protein [Streptomyces sp. DSM 44918]
MLLRFQVTNHASLRDEQELSLVASDRHPERAERSVPRSDHRVVPTAAIYGTNASGKSNVIDAITWMRDAVLSSFRHWDPSGGIPRRPFKLRAGASVVPSEFVIEFVVDDVRYEFGFAVDDEQVLEEWLYYYPEGRARRLYERKSGEPDLKFSRWLTGRRTMIAQLLRPNSLYLSVAAAQGHEQLRRIYGWFRYGLLPATDLDFADRLQHTVHLYTESSHQSYATLVMDLLRFADLGVAGLEISEPDEAAEEMHQRFTQLVRQTLGDKVQIKRDGSQDVRVEHQTDEGKFALGLADESSGTRTWIGLVGPVVTTLTSGAVLVVDELDARLHPYLTDALVGIFQRPETNPLGAQLVFSTHEASLLGRSARTELFRDQVWFTEKDPRSLSTRLFPLTEFHVRDGIENLEKRYLEGRYGAVPFLDDDMLRGVAEARRDRSTRGAGQREEVAGPTEEFSSGAA